MARLIGVDLDDVLMDFNAGLCAFHNAYYGTSLVKDDITSYHLEETWGCSRKEAISRVVQFYHSSEHEATPSVDGAIEVVRELQDNLVDFVIITSRPESVREQTHLWLAGHFPTLVKKIYFTSHFYHQETMVTKADVCRDLGVEVFIDDAPFHIEDVAVVVKRAILFDAPWNQNHCLTLPNMYRVHSWSEIQRLLKE